MRRWSLRKSFASSAACAPPPRHRRPRHAAERVAGRAPRARRPRLSRFRFVGWGRRSGHDLESLEQLEALWAVPPLPRSHCRPAPPRALTLPEGRRRTGGWVDRTTRRAAPRAATAWQGGSRTASRALKGSKVGPRPRCAARPAATEWAPRGRAGVTGPRRGAGSVLARIRKGDKGSNAPEGDKGSNAPEPRAGGAAGEGRAGGGDAAMPDGDSPKRRLGLGFRALASAGSALKQRSSTALKDRRDPLPPSLSHASPARPRARAAQGEAGRAARQTGQGAGHPLAAQGPRAPPRGGRPRP